MEGETCDLEKWADMANMSNESLWAFLEEEEHLETLNKLPTFMLLCVLMIVGIPGNILVLIVYGLRFPASTTKVFIMAMAAYDLLNCVVGMPFEMVDLEHDLMLDIPIPCKVFRFLVTLSACGSVSVLIVVAVDRFRRICRPFRKQMTVVQSKVITGGTLIISLAFSSPALLLYGRQTDIRFNHKVYDCSIDDTFRKSSFAQGYQYVLGVTWVACIIILVAMYGFIIYKIHKQRKRRRNLSAHSGHGSQALNNVKISITDTSLSENLRAATPSKTEVILTSGDISLTRTRNGNMSIYCVKDLADDSDGGNAGSSSRLIKDAEDSADKTSSEASRSLKRLFSRDVNPVLHEDAHIFDTDVTEASYGEDDALSWQKRSSSSTKKNESMNNFLDCSTDKTDTNRVLGQDYQIIEPDVNVTSCDDEDVLSWHVDITMSALNTKKKESMNNFLDCSTDTDFILGSEIEKPKQESSAELQPDTTPIRARKYGHCFGRYRPWESMYVPRELKLVQSHKERDWTSNSLPRDNRNSIKIRKSSSSPCLLRPDLYITRLKEIVHGVESDCRLFGDPIDSIDHKQIQAFENICNLSCDSLESLRYLSTFNESDVSQRKQKHSNVTWDSMQLSPAPCPMKSSQLSINKMDKSQRTASVITLKSRKKSFGREIKTSRVSMMMLLVTLGFVLSYLPHLFLQIYSGLFRDQVSSWLCPRGIQFLFYHVFFRSFFINNAINPIIYSFYNKTFRNRCFKLLKSPKSLLRGSTNDHLTSASQENDTS
ncbi:cholecystokinin receptor [Biomphalaria pfeifferi]|uniref:Cholecystokinin receptor n=1 Tax=Biomphalaria pfeifferi TaxID=112525 RepID=A0AAD8FIN8_BIOPF|nr:cholecystokinin receptor [Biomphalaria pfeifferi]